MKRHVPNEIHLRKITAADQRWRVILAFLVSIAIVMTVISLVVLMAPERPMKSAALKDESLFTYAINYDELANDWTDERCEMFSEMRLSDGNNISQVGVRCRYEF